MPTSMTNDVRIAVLLRILGSEAAESVLGQLPPARARRLKARLAEFDSTAPDGDEVDEVLDEFHRVLKFALADHESPGSDARERKRADERHAAPAPEPPAVFEPSGDPFQDLARLQPFQVAGALRDETPALCAVVLGCLPADQAGQVIQRLPESLRREVFLKINAPQKTPAALQTRILQAVVDKGCRLDRDAAADPDRAADEKLARVLRSMDRSTRKQMIEALEESDAETADRIKALLYVFEDLLGVSDRSIQKLLAEIDSTTLATALKNADSALLDKVLHNLSRRARATVLEEIEYLGPVAPPRQAEAEQSICDVLAKLDQSGDLEMVD